MSYISTEAYNASVIYSFSELSPNDKFILDKNGEAQTCTLKEIQGVSGGITIRVVAPEGSAITVSDGNVSFAQEGITTVFNIPNYGTWTVSQMRNGETKTKTVSIQQTKEYIITFANIYGIQRDTTSSSPEWTRTDSAIGFEVTASVGAVAGESDFDDKLPWSGMKRYAVKSTYETPLNMVRIPAFWYQRKIENDIETIRIADAQLEGFEKHPGSDCYVASYYAGVSHPSKGDGNAAVGMTSLSSARSKIATENGTGWYLTNLAAWSAIQMLYLVEFANNNSQSVIGHGFDHYQYDSGHPYHYKGTKPAVAGTTDGVANLTGITTNANATFAYVVYRGIENVYGGPGTTVDGIVVDNGNNGWICNDVQKCSDTPTSDYSQFPQELSGLFGFAYISKMSYDPSQPWIMLPVASSGSGTTYYCDGSQIQARGGAPYMKVVMGSGYYTSGSNGYSDANSASCGMFAFCASVDTTSTGREYGSASGDAYRVMYKPELDTDHTTTITGLWS